MKRLKIPKVGFKCFCGKDSVKVDTWFRWYPCEDHTFLTPSQYQQLENEGRECEKVKDT